MSVRLDPNLLAVKLRERGLLWEDLDLPPATQARVKAGHWVRPRTASKVISKIRNTPVAPDLAELIAS